jgi:hypothetical protein
MNTPTTKPSEPGPEGPSQLPEGPPPSAEHPIATPPGVPTHPIATPPGMPSQLPSGPPLGTWGGVAPGHPSQLPAWPGMPVDPGYGVPAPPPHASQLPIHNQHQAMAYTIARMFQETANYWMHRAMTGG